MSNQKVSATNGGVNWWLFREKPGEFAKVLAIGISAAIVVMLFVLPRIGSVLPKILGDELLYSQHARLLSPSEWTLPNYLFYWVFSSTNACGYEFYSCGKSINFTLLLGIGFVIYLTARLVAAPWPSLYLAVLTLIGPIAVYASYFTPDTMFFLGMSIVIYRSLRANSESKFHQWILLGAILGVTSTVKPHALFVIPALVVYSMFLISKYDVKGIGRGILNSGILILSTLSAKFALGFAIAGPKGLSLFGPNYEGAWDSATRASSLGYSESTSHANVLAVTVSETDLPKQFAAEASNMDSYLSMTVWELVIHAGFIAFMFSVPVLLAFRHLVPLFATRELTEKSVAQKLSFLSLLVLATGIVTTSVFTAFAPTWGEILDFRLMIRYYEYVFPFLVILTLITLPKSKAKVSVYLGVLILSILAIASTTKLAKDVPPLFTDSTLFSGLYFSNISIWVFCVAGIALLLYGASAPENARKYWLYGWLPAITILVAISTQIGMTNPSSEKGMYTVAAQTAHDKLSLEQREQLLVVGNYKNNVQASQLWIDSKGVQGVWLDRGQTVNVDALGPEINYVLLIGELGISGNFRIIEKSESFAIVERLK